MTLRRLLGLALAATVLAGCGGGGAKGPTGTLVQSLPGASKTGTVVIDEVKGTVGKLFIGEPLSQVKQQIPKRYDWQSNIGSAALLFCSHPSGDTCDGALLQINTDPNATPGSAPTVGEIDLAGGYDAHGNVVDGQTASTLRGIHVGSSERDLLKAYPHMKKGKACFTSGAGTAATYLGYVNGNSLGFEVRAGVVRWIFLVGREIAGLC